VEIFFFSCRIKQFQSDNGGEYVSNQFTSFFTSNVMLHHLTCPYTFQQNGVTERKRRHVMDIRLSLLAQSCLVAKGFDQVCGVDFSNTFSPVIKPTTVRVILALVVHFGWPLCQLDISNAFIHGNLIEEVYMKQPRGFFYPFFLDHVCQLHKALYYLK
jgi:transposase InsO family protein